MFWRNYWLVQIKGGLSIRDSELLINKIIAGKLGLHQVDLPASEAVEIRRKAVEKLTGADLGGISAYVIDAESSTKRNIENMNGAVQVPVGIAGPLTVSGQYANGEFYVPLATTEGALVASVNRGCKAITEAGGACVRILNDEMTRAPVFAVSSIGEAQRVVEWVKKPVNFAKLQKATEETTKHGKLIRIDPYVVADNVFLRCAFDTKDALGMNMVTIAADRLADVIVDALNIRLVALAGNMCIDKKPAAINLIEGRGKNVIAEISIPRNVVKRVLKTTPESISDVHYRKNVIGSIKAGSLGFNAHAANVVAAIFIATGQDAAHVVESSTAITSLSVRGDELYASVSIPSLPVGTVGGGTTVKTQEECLSIMDVASGGKPPGAHAKKFAEITGCAVLAGELSLLAALATHHLARAHATLGR
ncbi:MAG: hydroxymethylglutaryl-CoA reductase (NADPH) [Euryarchaeota archaeon]|nr:hydroxymethylglutaryl-CoA reductase (NADPH) [Euryarchaeota archaeon]